MEFRFKKMPHGGAKTAQYIDLFYFLFQTQTRISVALMC